MPRLFKFLLKFLIFLFSQILVLSHCNQVKFVLWVITTDRIEQVQSLRMFTERGSALGGRKLTWIRIKGRVSFRWGWEKREICEWKWTWERSEFIRSLSKQLRESKSKLRHRSKMKKNNSYGEKNWPPFFCAHLKEREKLDQEHVF